LIMPTEQLDRAISSDKLLDSFGICKDGTRLPIDVKVTALQLSLCNFTLVSMQDNTARLRADAVEQQMTAIVEDAEDAILTKSLDGEIKSWNSGAERLLGYSAREVVGGPVTRLIPSHLQDEETLILSRIRKGERVSHFETLRRKSDGSVIEVSLTISPVRDRSGTIVGASKIMRDISARKLAEQTLRRSNAELHRLNEELDEFVYTASHDLRSPLTNIESLAQWILDDDPSLGAQTRDRLLLIQRRIERMKKLLNDIREYARSGSSDATVAPPMSAAMLLADVIDSVGIPPRFSVQIDPLLYDVEVRRIPVAQVFHNLIGNAVKHHDGQGGIIQLSVESSRPMWRFVVRDDGPGVDKEYREEIFGMFKTLKPRDEVEGSGMGLALVRKLVTRMGGVCGVEPAPVRGAQFWFDWPKLVKTTEPVL
jgi:PAS domain S-box-containing protein